VFNSVLGACALVGHWEQALALVEDMESLGLQPDTISLNAALGACQEGGRWPQAVGLWERMEGMGVAGDSDTYACLAATASGAQEWSEVLKLVEAMRMRGLVPGTGTYWLAVSACRQLGLDSQAEGLMVDMGRHPRWGRDLGAANKLQSIYRGNKARLELERNHAAAAKVQALFRGRQTRINPYAEALAECEELGDWERGFELVDAMLGDDIEGTCL
jgi:pentatricopeptide repeat protein